MRDWLIGIDDTDNLDSRGTGHRARMLLAAIEHGTLAEGVGVTRHQLLFDPRIPYTSHNSCACLHVRSTQPRDAVFEFCREFLLEDAADGSDVGLAMATPDQAAGLRDYGRAAKHDVLDQAFARENAAAQAIRLEGLTGTRDGIIGALAGMGLFADGNDGRYLWKRGLREMAEQTVTVRELVDTTGIDDIRVFEGPSIINEASVRIALGPWPRPVRVEGSSVLLVTRGTRHEGADYECLDKPRLKAFRP